jgi:arginase family enzyme
MFIAEAVAKIKRMVAMDLVEVNPLLENEGAQRTIETALKKG